MYQVTPYDVKQSFKLLPKKILFAKLPTAVAHTVILIDKINLSFTNVISNVESH